MAFGQTGVRRIAATSVLVMAAAVTALAQRGGYQSSSGYSGNQRYDGKFVFVRISYPVQTTRQAWWAHDWPDGEEHFMKILTTVSNLNGHVNEHNIMGLSDPELFKFPVIYLCEPGYLQMMDSDVMGLRNYLQKGGFMIVDDFRYAHWSWFETQMSRVFPQGRWFNLSTEHRIFHSFFEINTIDNVPNYYDGGRPIFRAMFEDNDQTKRMLMVANYNTDLSEYWEFSERGYRPVDETNEAYKIGVNQFIYGITH